VLAVVALIFLGSAPSPPSPHAVTAPPAPAAPPAPVAIAPYHLAWSEAGFAVDFPGKPYQATSPVTTSGISLTMHAATWSSDRRTLDITAMYMPGGLAISGRAVPDAGCTSGVRAAQGTDVTVRWASAGRYPARETWYTVDGQRMVMRCFVAGRQFYTISGTPSEFQTALRSFRRLP
jgi:hypothetical protein